MVPFIKITSKGEIVNEIVPLPYDTVALFPYAIDEAADKVIFFSQLPAL